MNRTEYVQKKFGSLENAKPMYDNMVLEAQKENLQFKLSSITKTPNTVASHILIDLARKEKVQKEVVYNIFSDYFEKGIDIGDENNLVKVGVKHGIDEDILKKELRSFREHKQSKQDGCNWKKNGNNGGTILYI